MRVLEKIYSETQSGNKIGIQSHYIFMFFLQLVNSDKFTIFSSLSHLLIFHNVKRERNKNAQHFIRKCSQMQNKIAEKRVLRCLFNLIFAYSAECDKFTARLIVYIFFFLSSFFFELLIALGCYFSAWIGWQFATSTNAWHFASAGKRKKIENSTLNVSVDNFFFYSLLFVVVFSFEKKKSEFQ